MYPRAQEQDINSWILQLYWVHVTLTTGELWGWTSVQ